MIDGEQGCMLASLLKKPNRKIKLDRLVKTVNRYRELLTELADVLKETQEHFQG